jgi:hypothetical protein
MLFDYLCWCKEDLKMYIRIKFFEKKSNNCYNKPLFFQEISGDNAIEIMIISITKHFFGDKLATKIKKIFDEEKY